MVLMTRRDAINRRITSKNTLLASVLTGIVFLIVPVLIVVIDPIHVIVKYKLRLAKGTLLYELLLHEIPAARLSVYLFNITNAERFMSGEDYKLKVEEVGPFVFQEYRWYEDLEMSEDGEQLAMTPKIRSEFIHEASIAHPKDINLNLPNLPMLSATAIMSNYPNFIRFTYSMLAAQLGNKAIINIDAHNYLWGYKNSLMTVCNSLAPGIVYFDKIGLLDRLYDNISDYRVIVGTTNQDRFKIKAVKKFTRIQMGSIQDVDESEQPLTDAYEGYGYPPMLTPDVPINLYRLGICKTFNLEYTGSRRMDYGGEALVYTISNKTFLTDVNPITMKAYPVGLMDISGCYYGLPFVISKTHFMDSDPKLLERIDGLKPDRNLHVNEIVIDQKASVTFNTKMSLQLNLVLNDISYNPEARMLSNTVIPVVHLKVDQPAMSPSTMSKFVLVYTIAPYIVLCIIVVSVVTGLALLAHAVRSMYLNWLSRNKGMVFEFNNNRKRMNAGLPLIR